MNKIHLIALGVIMVIIAAFYALNSFIYTEKQEYIAALPDGTHLGFIESLIDNNTAMDFDDAQWLSGKAGEDAAIEAGLCTEETRSECLPNDYYIDNQIEESTRVPISPDVSITMQTWKMEETGGVNSLPISLEEFSALINETALWRELPFNVTARDGVITSIQEVYIP